MFTNLKLIFSQRKYILGYILLVMIFSALWWYFTDIKLMFGNSGTLHASIDTVVSVVNIFAFSLFIVAWIFRSTMFGKLSHKGDSAGFLGGILGVLISGTLCCGSSLLIPLGASVFTTTLARYLPYDGLELKTLGVLILLFGLYRLLKNLTVCQAKKSH
ncbi:hypothetical protein HG442_004010 [Candidatus Gracilibacteria bacterium]|nr:hypothetical protein [Candidatus Gracilibacteria bacterium]